MKHPAQHIVNLASSRVPWLLPAIGIAVFVHRQFIKYRSQDTAGAKAKARLKSRPPKLRRVWQKTKSNHIQVSALDPVEAAEHERLAAAGLSSDKLMEWFTEDELEALQQAQAKPAALLSLLSGTRFMADDGYGLDSGSEWYTDDKDNNWPDMLESESCVNSSYNSRRNSHETAFAVEPLAQLSLELVQSSGRSSNQQQQDAKQQNWQATQHLLQAPEQALQQQQHQQQSPEITSPAAAATVGSVSGGGDYFEPLHYFGLSPAANRSSRTSLDIAQGRYLPMRGALWASSYPPHLDDLDFAINEEHQTTAAPQQLADRQRTANSNMSNTPATSGGQQQPQEDRHTSSRRWLQEYEPPMPDYEPDFDLDLDDMDLYYDYEPDYVPGFDDDLAFDQLDAAFATAAMHSMGDVLLSSH